MSSVQTNPRAALQHYFGFSDFQAGQQAIIEHLLAGRSAAAIFPTGGGKSLCYQLPALMLDGLTLVVSPLIALMKDQIDALAARGIHAQRLDSSLSLDEYRSIMQDIRTGNLQILYVAPERFNNERFRAAMQQVTISLFAIDEAHCISEWGHNFRPDYLKLASYASSFKAERILALTATATHAVRQDICDAFDIAGECAISTGFYRSNLTLKTTIVRETARDELLLQRFSSSPRGPSIVYVTLQKTAEKVAELLQANGVEARYYHAGLKPELREAVQDWFIASDTAVVVATIAFGMGIDKANIRYIYHYNLPKTLENYALEIGRAGRDGQQAVCELMACREDLIPLENFIYGDTPARTALESFVQSVFSQPDHFSISHYQLSNDCDIRQLVLRTLLTRLELAGYLTAGTPVYDNYQFKALESIDTIPALFDEHRAHFLRQVFELSRKANTWYHIDVAATADVIGSDRNRIVRALEYLEQQALLEVRTSGVLHRYHILRRPESASELAAELYENAQAQQTREIQRLQDVLEWITLDACQSSALSARFDESLEKNCGHCGWCTHGAAHALPDEEPPAIDPAVLQQAQQLQQDLSSELATPVAVARVLCGISSPALAKARLGKHKLFARLEKIPYLSVLAALSKTGDRYNLIR